MRREDFFNFQKGLDKAAAIAPLESVGALFFTPIDTRDQGEADDSHYLSEE